MENFFLNALIQEMTARVVGYSTARVFGSGSTFRIDLRPSGEQIVVSLDRSDPALFLSSTANSEVSEVRFRSTSFVASLRKHITGSILTSLYKTPRDRLVRFNFESVDAAGDKVDFSLLVALTGRSANAYLTDGNGDLIAAMSGDSAEDADSLIEKATDDFSDSVTKIVIKETTGFFDTLSEPGKNLPNGTQ